MANQKFPRIGLYAVFELAGFNRSMARYMTWNRNIDRITKQTAQSVTRTTQQMTGSMARSWDDFIKASKEVEAILRAPTDNAAYTGIKDAFFELGRAARVNVSLFDELTERGVNYTNAMQAAGGVIQFDIGLFDKLTQKGVEANQAFTQAAASARLSSQSISILGRSFTQTAAASALMSASIGAAIAIVRKSISEYNNLAEATRRLRAQTGLLSEEASGWVLATRASGISAAAAERALTSFLGKVSDLSREQARGEEGSSRFAEAIETLDIDLQNADGTLKTTADLLADVDDAFRRLGPGALSAETATALFGFSGRALLPILQSETLSLTRLQQTAKDYGATLNGLSQQEYEEFKRSQFELLTSLQGVYNYIAKKWTPVLTEIQRIIASSVSIWRTFVQIMTGTEQASSTLADRLNNLADVLHVVNQLFQIGAKWIQKYHDALNPMAAAAREAAAAEERLAQARGIASQAASEARDREKARQDAIEETIVKLDELKSKLIEKLDDIDRDAGDKWDDILVKRQRDAIDRARGEAFRLIDLKYAYDQQLDKIEADFAKRWDDIFVKRQRDALLNGIRLAQRFEDLARSTEQRRLDAIRDASERGAELRRDAQKRLADTEQDARDKREKLEREHQRRLFDIQQGFLDTAQEAARRNDAVAVARALRERARELRDEQRRFAEEQLDLKDSLAKKRQDIEDDRREREVEHRQELARTLQRIEENRQRQLEAIVRQNERERVLREIRYRWELEDLEKAKAEQLQAAEDQYNKQLDALRLAQAREQLERDIQYQRELDDFKEAQQRKIDEAIEWYKKERDALATHLALTGQQLEAVYEDWAQTAAEAAIAVAKAAADAIAEEIIRYQHLLTEAERARAQARTPAVGGGSPALPPQTMRRNDQGIYVPGAPILGMAEGGVVQASSPTHIVMGEGGPETGVFLPGGRGGSLNVNHNFGQLGVNFEGLPGGMNTQQVQAIVYSVVTQLAKGIQVPR